MRSDTTDVVLSVETRRKRRDTVKSTIEMLCAVRAAEERYLNNTPENFQGSESYETGELAVEALDEIIDMLEAVY